jgi:hypothetical protein
MTLCDLSVERLRYSVKVEAFEDAAARCYVKGPVKPSTGTDPSALRASSKIEAEDTVDILISRALIP